MSGITFFSRAGERSRHGDDHGMQGPGCARSAATVSNHGPEFGIIPL
jgi:hypothetical protein